MVKTFDSICVGGSLDGRTVCCAIGGSLSFTSPDNEEYRVTEVADTDGVKYTAALLVGGPIAPEDTDMILDTLHHYNAQPAWHLNSRDIPVSGVKRKGRSKK